MRRIATTTLFVSSLLAACYGQLLPCAPDCRHEDDGALFPNPRNCTKFFQCAYNIAVPHHCSAGLVFNPVVLVCDFPDSAGCVEDPDLDCSDGKTTTTAATVETTTVINSTVSLPASSVDPTTTTYVRTTTAHPTNSTTASPVSTTVSTTIAATVETTTVINSTVSLPVSSVDPTTTTYVRTTTAQPTNSTTASPVSTTVSGECTPECPSAEAMFPNPRDCASFYKCAFNHPFVVHCPAGQWYDGPNHRCDYIELVECNAGPDAPCVAVTYPTEPPQETTTAITGSTTTDGGEDCVPPCPSAEAMYPNPRDCSTFFKCAFGVPNLMHCPAGQEYAAALERCDYPEVAECTAGPDRPCVAVTNPPQF